MNSPFEDIPVLGAMTPAQASKKLREVGEDAAATAIDEGTAEHRPETFSAGRFAWWPFQDRPWQHTAHAFGFLPAEEGRSRTAMKPIQAIGAVNADVSLRRRRVKIVLNQLRVANYPGRGTHRILFDFYARNQISGKTEDLHFNATYRVREGERAPIAGYPIFFRH
jgi:hypothetical protein